MNEDLAKLLETGKITKPQVEPLSSLLPGAFCLHATFGAGKVSSWDTLAAKVLIDFEGKPAHPMGLNIAIRTLKPLLAEHVLAQWLEDPEGMRCMAAEDVVAFVGAVLHGVGGEMSFDEFEGVVKGRIVAEADYKKWWDGAKRLLRGHREFVIPAKRNQPMMLRETNLTAEEQLIEDFDLARDLKQKARLLQDMKNQSGLFAGNPAQLVPVVENAGVVAMKSQRLQPAAAIELMLARDQLVEAVEGLEPVAGQPTFADLIRTESGHLADAVRGAGVAGARAVTRALPEAFGVEWPRRALEILSGGCGPRAFAELATILLADEAGRPLLEEFLRRGLASRSLDVDALTWLCKERAGDAAPFFGPEAGLAVLEGAERVFSRTESTRGNKLMDLLQSDATLVADMLEGAPPSTVRSFARRLMGSPALDDLSRRSLLARVIKKHPDAQALVEQGGGESQEEPVETLLVSEASLVRRKAELQDLMQRQIPDNTRDISIAREYGDLRENFEYKSAKQMQAVLMRRKEEIEGELERAKVVDLSAPDTSVVSLGTVVVLEHDEGSRSEVTLLGAWDGDPERHILSYLSAKGQVLLGRAVGEEVVLPGESGEGLKARIVSIRAAGTPVPA